MGAVRPMNLGDASDVYFTGYQVGMSLFAQNDNDSLFSSFEDVKEGIQWVFRHLWEYSKYSDMSGIFYQGSDAALSTFAERVVSGCIDSAASHICFVCGAPYGDLYWNLELVTAEKAKEICAIVGADFNNVVATTSAAKLIFDIALSKIIPTFIKSTDYGRVYLSRPSDNLHVPTVFTGASIYDYLDNHGYKAHFLFEIIRSAGLMFTSSGSRGK